MEESHERHKSDYETFKTFGKRNANENLFSNISKQETAMSSKGHSNDEVQGLSNKIFDIASWQDKFTNDLKKY